MITNILKENIEKIASMCTIAIEKIEFFQIINPTYGHYCTNIIQKYRLNKEIQTKILDEILKNKLVEKANIVNNFINISLKYEYFFYSVNNILNSNLIPDIGNNEKINIEYCSVNPTGYLHIGHTRNAILGDAIAKLLSKVNYNVTKEYYVNDSGNQIKLLAESVYARYSELNNIENIFPQNGYLGEEIYEVAKELPENLSIKEIERFCIKFFINKIKKDLNSLQIMHDNWVYESEIIEQNYIQKAIKILEYKDCLKYGVLEQKKVNKGVKSTNNLLILKTSLFGDDQDRPLTKEDGSWTYFAPDIGYHLNKIERGYKKLICILGADHDSYAKRMKIAVSLLDEKVQYNTPICQLVTFKNMENDIEKFSKRKGNSIRISDFVQIVNKDIIKFMMLEKSCDTQFIFDPIKAKEISNKNPVFYCQYAHSRACSILKNVKINTEKIHCSKIFQNKDIQNFIITLEQFGNIIKDATHNLAPYKIINYLKKISENMHKSWQIGITDGTLRYITNDSIETNTRINIIKAFLKISKECFDILGISALEKMEQQF